jgi:LPXTG-motif cell wall-anchored protein
MLRPFVYSLSAALLVVVWAGSAEAQAPGPRDVVNQLPRDPAEFMRRADILRERLPEDPANAVQGAVDRVVDRLSRQLPSQPPTQPPQPPPQPPVVGGGEDVGVAQPARARRARRQRARRARLTTLPDTGAGTALSWLGLAGGVLMLGGGLVVRRRSA